MRGLRQKAAGVESGGRRQEAWLSSRSDRLAALPTAGPGGNNRRARFPARHADEGAHGTHLSGGRER
jgi:hypothetical protein